MTCPKCGRTMKSFNRIVEETAFVTIREFGHECFCGYVEVDDE